MPQRFSNRRNLPRATPTVHRRAADRSVARDLFEPISALGAAYFTARKPSTVGDSLAKWIAPDGRRELTNTQLTQSVTRVSSCTEPARLQQATVANHYE
jgi:hypothetical protein